jgi:hypothetical protein
MFIIWQQVSTSGYRSLSGRCIRIWMRTETKYHDVGELRSFLTSLLGGNEWLSTNSGCFTLGEKAAVQIERDAG